MQPFRVPRWAGKTLTGFPKELRMRHRYVENSSLSSAGGQANAIFSCNGMFDPNVGGAGSQPLYFDQLAGIYNHYTVLASKCTVRLTGNASMAIPILCNVFINDDSTLTPSFRSLQEQNSAVYGTLVPSGNQNLTLTKRWSASENFGPGPIADPNLQGTSAANPTEQQMYHLSVQVADLATTYTLYYTITIEYDCVWQELKDISTS